MNVSAIDMESRTLRLERDFKASKERVFEAFVNPEHVTQWWGPEGMHASVVEMDTQVGGKWLTTMTSDSGDDYYTACGVYRLIERPDHLVYTWCWLEEGERGPESTIDLTFTEIEGGTRLTLVHSLFNTVEERDDHGEGWTSSLNCLGVFLQQA